MNNKYLQATSSSLAAPARVHATDAVGFGSSSQSVPSTSREQSMNFSFYHCTESLVWDVEAAECEVCTEVRIVGDVNVSNQAKAQHMRVACIIDIGGVPGTRVDQLVLSSSVELGTGKPEAVYSK